MSVTNLDRFVGFFYARTVLRLGIKAAAASGLL